jgi:hypothetical protein
MDLSEPFRVNVDMAQDAEPMEAGPSTRSHRSGASSMSLRHPPPSSHSEQSQPALLRTSQLPATPIRKKALKAADPAHITSRAILQLDGDLDAMAVGWSPEEWEAKRRLVQFWRTQDGNTIKATFRPLRQTEYRPHSIVISCIYREETNDCYVTSVDSIYLLEALVATRFTVEEKNRIRRNLEGFKPATVTKSKADSEGFFKLIMGFPNPKPRNIEKDVKVFPWKILTHALKKIIGKVRSLSRVCSRTNMPEVLGYIREQRGCRTKPRWYSKSG